MKKTVQIGASGKNPAIEKINRLQALNSQAQAVTELERRIFSFQKGEDEEINRQERIIRDFSIHFAPFEE